MSFLDTLPQPIQNAFMLGTAITAAGPSLYEYGKGALFRSLQRPA